MLNRGSIDGATHYLVRVVGGVVPDAAESKNKAVPRVSKQQVKGQEHMQEREAGDLT